MWTSLIGVDEKVSEGASFYAVRMVSGQTRAIEAAQTLDARLALLPSVFTAAEALAYAHAHHVIHRDIATVLDSTLDGDRE